MGEEGTGCWRGDPYRRHEARYFVAGRPTSRVRDWGRESNDPPPLWGEQPEAPALVDAPLPASSPPPALQPVPSPADPPPPLLSLSLAPASSPPASIERAVPSPQPPEPATPLFTAPEATLLLAPPEVAAPLFAPLDEEEQRFVQWMAVSEQFVTDHKDALGWEEPHHGVLKRLVRHLERGALRSTRSISDDHVAGMAAVPHRPADGTDMVRAVSGPPRPLPDVG